MFPANNLERLLASRATIAELKGIGDAELKAGVALARVMIDRGDNEAASDILAGLLLYDPTRSDTWRALEELLRRMRLVRQANLVAEVARALAM